MKVERGHVCNINVVHFWTVSIMQFSSPSIVVTGRRDWRLHISVLDDPVVYFTDRISWTGCSRSHFCSHCCSKRKEDTSTKEGSGEEGHRMTVLACILIFSSLCTFMIKRALLCQLGLCLSSVRSLSAPRCLSNFASTSTNTQFSAQQYAYNIRLAISTPILHFTLRIRLIQTARTLPMG